MHTIAHTEKEKEPDERISSEEPPDWSCKICSLKFKNDNNLSKHVKIVHGNNERFQCNLCENSISSEYNLE